MLQTVIWDPPPLCDCRFLITADWPDYQGEITYKHPTPFTIQRIELISCCDEHKELCKEMPDVSELFDLDRKTNRMKQNRGYLRYPIENPTEAEILYTHFYFHGGQVRSFPCGCSAYQHVCPAGNISVMEHPIHSGKCFVHANDTPEMDDAEWDFQKEVKEAAVESSSEDK